MNVVFPKVAYEVNLYERNEDNSLGSRYWTETFYTQKEVKEFLNERSKTEVFHFSVSLIGGLSSW